MTDAQAFFHALAQTPIPDQRPLLTTTFLHAIIHTIHQELRGHPQVDGDRLDAWARTRHAQIDRGELLYIAHQLDYLVRPPA